MKTVYQEEELEQQKPISSVAQLEEHQGSHMDYEVRTGLCNGCCRDQHLIPFTRIFPGYPRIGL